MEAIPLTIKYFLSISTQNMKKKETTQHIKHHIATKMCQIYCAAIKSSCSLSLSTSSIKSERSLSQAISGLLRLLSCILKVLPHWNAV